MQFEKERKESDDSARKEARSIVNAMKNGLDMTEELTITPRTLRALYTFCKQYPNDAFIVLTALEFRKKVREYVDRLITGEDISVGADNEEAEEDIGLTESTVTEAAWGSVQAEEESPASEAQA